MYFTKLLEMQAIMKFSQVKLNCVQDSLPVYYHLFLFRKVSQTVLEKLRNLFPSLGCGIALSTWSIWYHITFSLFGRMNLFSTDMNTDIKFCIMKADVLSLPRGIFFHHKGQQPSHQFCNHLYKFLQYLLISNPFLETPLLL